MRTYSWKAIALVGLTAALIGSLFGVSPVLGAGQSTGSSNAVTPAPGPQLSGIFQSASSFRQDPPGQGTVSMTSCMDGTDLGGGNIRINCDSTTLPHNEMAIAVDPAHPNHLVAGSNDYEISFVGATIVERVVAGYYTSFDGGKTWLTGHVPPGGFTFTGDPAVAFNPKWGLVHYAVIAFQGGQVGGFADASVQVSASSDGGRTFGRPVVVALGTGGTRVTIFNDKPYITVDNNPTSHFYGRLYVTWTRFLFGPFGNYIESPIFFAFSDDGGSTFSVPMEISGTSSTFCTKPLVASNAGTCNEDQFSSPVVGPDGTVYVAFENGEFQGAPEFRDQYLVVRSSDGGRTWQGPFQAVGPISDGIDDYPINVDGRQTLSNSQFRVNSAGNLAVDPHSGPDGSSTVLYIAFSDNSNGVLTGSFKTVQTNTDVFVTKSSNGGTSWTSANPVASGDAEKNDQFYPWAAVSDHGTLLVAYKDRSYDPGNIKSGETLVSSNDGATFSRPVRVDTGLSNPNDSRWFTNRGQTNGKATFIGDYEGLAIGSDGVAHPLWTDMRIAAFPNPPSGRGHNTQDAVTAAVPPPTPP